MKDPRHRALWCLLALLTALLPAGTCAARADGSDGRSPLHRFCAELGVAGDRTRYVVLVDTASLDGARLAHTRAQLGTLLKAASRPDEITLVLFDRRVRRIVGPLTEADLRTLDAPRPAPAEDGPVDLVAALHAAVTALERDLPRRAALVTLAEPRPAGARSGATVDATLRRRAAALAAHTTLTVHAFPLGADAETRARHLTVLEDVFPTAVATGPWSGRVRPDLAQVTEEVLRHAALAALADDRSGRVVVAWPRRPPRLDPAEGRARIALTLRSTMRKVPLTVSGLRFSVTDDAAVRVFARPLGTKPVELKPGATATVPVELSWTADRYRLGRETLRVGGRLTVRGEVGTPWAQRLASVGVHTVPPPLPVATVVVSGAGPVGVPGWLTASVGGGVAGIVLVWALVAVVARIRRRPRMRGRLTARYPENDAGTWVDRELGPVDLSGHRALATAELYPAGEGVVHVWPGRREGGAVRALHIRCVPHGEEERGDDGVCPVGGSVIVNGVEFVHHR